MTLRCSYFLLSLGFCVACKGSTASTSGDGDGDHASSGGQGSGDGDTGGDGDGDTGDGDLGTQTGGNAGTGSSGSGASSSGGESGGGSSGIGEGGATDGDGGTGTGGEGGTGGTGEPEHVPVPSSGCDLAMAEPPLNTFIDGATQIKVSTPEGYDGSTPGPLIIGLNGNAGSKDVVETATSGDGTPDDIVRDFLIAKIIRASGPDSSWEFSSMGVYDSNYEFIESTLCFDTSRIFGVGNAAGGRFFTRHTDEESSDGIVRPRDFRAIALAEKLLVNSTQGWPEVPLLFVHSTQNLGVVGTTSDPDGSGALGWLQGRMECQEGTSPAGGNTCDGGTSTCTDYTECNAPLRFCSHDLTTGVENLWECLHTVEVYRFFLNYL